MPAQSLISWDCHLAKIRHGSRMMTVEQLNSMSELDFVRHLGGVYEHSSWVAERVLARRPFDSRSAMVAAMRMTVESALDQEKLDLISSHPDLAGKLARAGALTEESTREQAGLGLDRLTDHEYDRFSALNSAYREKFGFPFIICARLTTKAGVLEAFERRLANSGIQEMQEALFQIHHIARLRMEDKIAP
jgi:2-oxo-4-hydroxy-4-carboxy-5-ureidoimidazoline decarboxylase